MEWGGGGKGPTFYSKMAHIFSENIKISKKIAQWKIFFHNYSFLGLKISPKKNIMYALLNVCFIIWSLECIHIEYFLLGFERRGIQGPR